MNPDRWDVLSSWHNAWLLADRDERIRLRAELAAKQPDLVAEADRLLAATATLPGFLETPAFVQAAHDLAGDDSTLAPGTMIGVYCIVDLMARGGMGDVYRAHDVRLERDVALKILAQTGPNDPQRVDRFLTEARVTASLDHPNIGSRSYPTSPAERRCRYGACRHPRSASWSRAGEGASRSGDATAVNSSTWTARDG